MRLIDADAYDKILDNRVMTLMEYSGSISGALMGCRALLAEQPTVDAKPVVHGEWSTIEDDYIGLVALKCSECNQEYWFEEEPPMKIYSYCPNCGARMDGDGNG